jgi:NTP pyrophosphatase (non-canonical NTP hydrolase)
MSILNQLHIDIEEETWKRFPYRCSYCASCPCVCKEKKVTKRRKIIRDDTLRPRSLSEMQNMFGEIYPSANRSIQDAGIHLAEEMGEFAEAVLIYRGLRDTKDFDNVKLEAADLMSCFMGVFNSLGASFAEDVRSHFHDNCYRCHQAPCVCTFTDVMNFKS